MPHKKKNSIYDEVAAIISFSATQFLVPTTQISCTYVLFN